MTDFIDIIITSEYFKKKLVFQNTKNQKNAEIYGKVLKELKSRALARNETVTFNVVQLRNNFKKVVAECKKAALVMKTARGIKRFQEEKNYGPWFNQLFELVKTRDSCQPGQAIEPREETDDISNSSTSAASFQNENKDYFVPSKKPCKKPSKENQFQELLGVMKALIEKDPLQDFLKFAREQEERGKQHELALVKLLMSQPTQVPMMNQPYSSPYMMSTQVQQYSNSAGAIVDAQSQAVLDESLVSFIKQIGHVDETDDCSKSFTSL